MFNVFKSSAWAAVCATFKKYIFLFVALSFFPFAANATPSSISSGSPYVSSSTTISLSWSTSPGSYDGQWMTLQEKVSGSWVTRCNYSCSNYSTSKSTGVYEFRLTRQYWEWEEYCHEEWGCWDEEVVISTVVEDSKLIYVTPLSPSTPTEDQSGNTDNNFNINWSTATYSNIWQMERCQANYPSTAYGSCTYHTISTNQVTQNTGSTPAIQDQKNYRYRIRNCIGSVSGSSCGGWSSSLALTVLLVPGTPPAPTIGSKSGLSDTSFTVNWSGPSGYRVTYYQMQRRTAAYNTGSYGGWSSAYTASSGWSDSNASSDGDYQYRVRACNESGCGGYSGPVTAQVLNVPGAAPNTPAIGGKSGLSDTSFTVNWSGPSGYRVTYYQMQRRTAAYNTGSYGSWSSAYTASSGWSDSSASGDGDYQYHVRACNEAGCGTTYSGAVSTQVLNAPGAAPAAINVTNKDNDADTTYTVGWSTVTSGRVTYYNLWRETEISYNSGTYQTPVVVQNTAATSFPDTQSYSSHFRYFAEACNEAGCGPDTSKVTVTVLTDSPGTPGAITGPTTSDDGSFTLSWTAPSGTYAPTYYSISQNGGSYQNIGLVTSKAYSGLSDGSYDYQVKACNVAGCSLPTGVKNVLVYERPAAITNLSGPATSSSGNYSLAWSAAPTSVTEYHLYEKVGAGAYVLDQIITSGTGATIWVPSTGTYSYKVQACNGPGGDPDLHCSSDSNVIQVAVTILDVPSPTSPSSYTSTSVVSTTEQQAMDQIGSVPGEFRVSESGSATYSIPIEVLPGTAGVAPEVSLSYSSNGGNGLAGLGWNVGGLSAISRCRKTVQQDTVAESIQWDANDGFCLDGQRLLLNSGTYGANGSTYRTEIDSFTTVTAKSGTTGDPAYFEVRRKDGSLSYYGNTADSSVDGATNGKTLTWAINRFEDNVGNEIVYAYIDDANGHRIDEISYAYGSGSTRNAYVEFVYEDRSDDQVGYVSGESFATKKRIDKIIVGGTSALREYRLFYDESGLGVNANDYISRLTSVQDCAVNVSPNRCLPKTEFTWEIAGINLSTTVASLSISGYNPVNYKPADLNGDGNLDVIYLDSSYNLRPIFTGINSTGGYTYTSGTAVSTSGNSTELQVFDYNGDGRQDVATYCAYVYGGASCGSAGWKVYLSVPQSGGGWQLSSSAIHIGFGQATAFVDLNGDGLADAVSGTSVKYLEEDSGASTGSSTPYHFGSSNALHFSPDMDSANEYVIDAIWAVGDFNGDGRMDLAGELYQEECFVDPYTEIEECYDDYNNFLGINQGYDSGEGAIVFDHPTGVGAVKEGLVVGDFNGDGLSDLLLPGTSDYGFYLGNGTGLTYQSALGAGTNEGVQVVDYNGDGFSDVYWVDTKVHYKLWDPSTQSFGSTDEVANTSSADISTVNSSSYFYHLWDMNSDSRSDLVMVHLTTGGGSSMSIRKNDGFNQPKNVISEIENGLGARTIVEYEPLSQTDHYTRVEGITSGSTTVEVCWDEEFEMYGETYTYEVCEDQTVAAANSTAFYTGLQTPFAGQNDSINPESSGPVLELMGPMYVVTGVSSSAPLEGDTGAYSNISYTYGQAKIQAGGRGMLGFKYLTTVDGQTGIKTRTEYRQDWPYIGMPVKTTVSLDGDLISESTNTWSVRSRTAAYSTSWGTTLASSGSAALGPMAPFIEQSIEKSYDPFDNTSNVISTVVTDNSYDGYGNPTQIVVKNYIGNQTTLVQTVTTDNTYNDTGSGLGTTYSQEFGRLTQTLVTTTRGASTIKSKSTFDYYNSGEGAPDDGAHTGSYTGHTGMLRSESIWASNDSSYTDTPENSVSSTYHYYDSLGNRVLSRTDASSTTRYSDRSVYDSLGRYVTETYGLFANGSGNATSYKTSQVITRDAFGTPTEVRSFVGTGGSDYSTSYNFTTARGAGYFSYDSTGNWSANNTIDGAGSLCPTGTDFHVRSRSAGGGEAYECFDILGRSVRKLARGFDGSWVKSDTYYDSLGRVKKVSEPYSSTAYYTVTTYDELGRVTAVDGPEAGTGDTTTFAYAGLEKLQTTPRGNTRREVHNVLGEVTAVYENKTGDVSSVDGVSLTSNERSEAHYQYSATGDLTQLTDAASNVTTMTYDDLGRKLSMVDPDKGTWTYAYNYFGEQICQEDAIGQVIWNTYDFRGRLIERNDYEENRSGVCNSSTQTKPTTDDGTTLWEYDQATDGLGQLNDVATLSNASDPTPDYAKSMTFDSLGRLSKTVTEIEGLSDDNWEKTTYDQYGRTFQVFDAARNSDNYPGSAANGIENRYNAYGYLDQIVDAAYVSSAPRSIYYDVQTMDVRGNVTAAEYGELLDVTSAYEADTGYLRWLAASDGTTTYQNYDLDWDEVGNLNYRRNMTGSTGGSGSAIANENETFVYDGMNRLKSFSVNGTTTSLGYNNIGNITSKSDWGGSYTYGTKPTACNSVTGAVTPGPHAVSVANSISYCYDANGNMIKDSNRTLTYTAYDMVASIDNGTYTTAFEYGPDRGRYMRTDDDGSNTTTTYYVGSVEKIYNDDGTIEWKRNIAGVGQITQIVNGSGVIQSESTAWFLKDHLGSVTHVVNTTSGGAVDTVTEMAFDPWGKRRTTTDWRTALSSLTPFYMTGGSSGSFTTTRGFTGHEMLDEVGIIHMNGRIYDASLGRFLQADPEIQAPTLTGSLNRYSYTMNNPLNATDPSGYNWISDRWHAAKDVVKVVATIAVGYLTGGAALASGSFWGAVGWGAAGGAINGAIMTNGSLKGIAMGAFSGAVFGGVSSHFGAGISLRNLTAYGTAGGIMSELQGGKFGNGFAAAGIGVFSGGMLKEGDSFVKKVLVRAVVGGTVSEVSGGKFANGARTGAFVAAAEKFLEYTTRVTDELKQKSCDLDLSVCNENKWGELLTDGVRGSQQIEGTEPGDNFFTRRGMAAEGSAAHKYNENGLTGRFINQVSKIHDYFNSNLSKALGFQGYDQSTGMWLKGGEIYNTAFQAYSFSGMLPAGAITGVGLSGGYFYSNPQLISSYVANNRRRR